jgi:cellulose synthase/poly-beta-1,6-N-acetylglucosamine synthase-like glycosyltransferase
MIIGILLMLPVVAYLILSGFFTKGLRQVLRQGKRGISSGNADGGISIIVAARNEGENLPRLISSLLEQYDLPAEMELIICDDYSEDDTAGVCTSIATPFPVRVFSSCVLGLPPGKKHALDYGIKQAHNELVLITDADTQPGTGWTAAYRETFSNPDLIFAAGLVRYTGPFRVLRGLEALDFYGLIGASAGAAGSGFPFMCNAANMGFRKWAYISVGGVVREGAPSSGDDVLLLHRIIKAYGSASVQWVAAPDAEVTTSGTDSLGAFFRQRIRWASKSKAYHNMTAVFTATTVLFANLSIMTGVALSLMGVVGIQLPLGLTGIKLIADYPLLRMITHHFRQTKLLWWLLPAAVLYPWYTSMIGVLSFFWKPVWKGRVIR